MLPARRLYQVRRLAAGCRRPGRKPSIGVRPVVRRLSLIALADERRGNDEVSGGAIAGHRDVPDHGYSQQRLYVRVMRLRLQRIPEEDEQVNLPVSDPGADLLVAAEWPALEAGHAQAELIAEQPAGGAGRE